MEILFILIILIQYYADGGLQVIVESVTDGHQDEVARESYQLDILKSIVYGGLVESITSLGVVSSAAGSGTATRKYSIPVIHYLLSTIVVWKYNQAKITSVLDLVIRLA